MLRKKIMIPILGLAVMGSGVMGSSYVLAQQDMTNPGSTLIQKLAQKFNLKESDVKAVFEEDRSTHEAKRKADLEQKISQAVTDGKITEAQKTAILNKLVELKSQRPDPTMFKNITEAERRVEMEKKKTEMESWAAQNGISLETLHQLIGRGEKGFGGRGFMHLNGNKPAPSPTPGS